MDPARARRIAQHLVLGVALVIGGLIVAEYTALVVESDAWAVSKALNWLRDEIFDLARWFGRTWAWLCSFLDLLHLDKVVRAIYNVIRPLLQILAAGLVASEAYWQQAKQYQQWIVPLGTITIIFIVVTYMPNTWRTKIDDVVFAFETTPEGNVYAFTSRKIRSAILAASFFSMSALVFYTLSRDSAIKSWLLG